jgi:hypothetical protein
VIVDHVQTSSTVFSKGLELAPYELGMICTMFLVYVQYRSKETLRLEMSRYTALMAGLQKIGREIHRC